MLKTLRALVLMIQLSLRADTPRSIGTILTAIGSSITAPLRAVGLRLLTDGVVAHNLEQALTGVVAMFGLTALGGFLFWASLNVRMRLRENTQLYVDALLMDLTSGIPGLEHHERPEYLDNVEVVRAERWALVNPFNPISWSVASMFQVAIAFVMLGSVHPLLALLPVASVPVMLGYGAWRRAVARIREEQAEPRRALRHLQDLTTEPAAAKEIRIYGLSATLLERRRALFGPLEAARVRLNVRMLTPVVLAWLVFAAAFGAALAFTASLAAEQVVTVGAVALVLGLGGQLNMHLGQLVGNLSWLMRTQSAIQRLVWLRDYAAATQRAWQPGAPADVPARLARGIEFQQVAFCYPGTERPVLHHVNVRLPAGTTVAIVGDNGAGKTTLVKLLSRMYEPTSGTILVDGVDLRNLPVADWRGRLAAGFQDFARLQLLARESVGVGDLTRLDEDVAIYGALDRAAASDVRDVLPAGLDTQLGRYFEGGLDLSLGQWQKVALGRAMMRERLLLLLLDEPTASLDAPTEHALFEHFAVAARDYAAASGAITILVSHRFSTVRMADLILVISGGEVVESGSHAELVQRGGLYAELYGLQAASYR